MGDYVFSVLLTRANSILFAIYTPLTGSFQPIFQQMVPLAIVVVGIGYMYGKIPPFISTLGAALLIVALTSLADVSMFKSWIYEPIFGTSIKLSTYVLSLTNPGGASSLSGVFNNLDSAFLDLTYRMQQHMNGLSWYDSGYIEAAIVYGGLMLLFGVLYLCFLAVMSLSVIGMHVLFVPAGIMILLGAFRQTRGFFFSWLRAVATYALTPVFASIVLAFSLGLLQKTVGHVSGLAPTASPFDIQALTGFFAFPLVILILYKAPEFSSSITGGVMSSVGGYFGTAAAGAASGLGVGAAVSTRVGAVHGAWKGADVEGMGSGQALRTRAYSAMLGLIK